MKDLITVVPLVVERLQLVLYCNGLQERCGRKYRHQIVTTEDRVLHLLCPPLRVDLLGGTPRLIRAFRTSLVRALSLS